MKDLFAVLGAPLQQLTQFRRPDVIAVSPHVEVPPRALLYERRVATIQVLNIRSIRVGQLTGSKQRSSRHAEPRSERDIGMKGESGTSPAAASRSSASFRSGKPSYAKRVLGQRSASLWSCSKRRRLKAWPTTVTRDG